MNVNTMFAVYPTNQIKVLLTYPIQEWHDVQSDFKFKRLMKRTALHQIGRIVPTLQYLAMLSVVKNKKKFRVTPIQLKGELSQIHKQYHPSKMVLVKPRLKIIAGTVAGYIIFITCLPLSVLTSLGYEFYLFLSPKIKNKCTSL